MPADNGIVDEYSGTCPLGFVHSWCTPRKWVHTTPNGYGFGIIQGVVNEVEPEADYVRRFVDASKEFVARKTGLAPENGATHEA